MQKTHRYKNLLIAGLIIVSILYTLFQFKSCLTRPEPIKPVMDSTLIWKSMIKKEQTQKDSLLLLSKQIDTSRTKIIVKYRWLKGRTDTIPCNDLLPQIVNVCDSIIYIDSTQISVLNQVIKKDSSIINDYRKIVASDSVSIIGLHKEIRKQKRQKKAILIGAAALIGVAIIR